LFEQNVSKPNKRIRAKIGLIKPEIGGVAIKKYSGIKSLKPFLKNSNIFSILLIYHQNFLLYFNFKTKGVTP